MYLSKRKVIFLTSIFLSILIFSFNQAKAQDVKVVDGDTIHLDGKKIRFGGIDAPESNYRGKKQTCIEDNKEVFCGQISKNKLIEKIGSNSLNCKIEKNKDKYKRLIGECFIKYESLSVFMVRNGYAFDWPRYSKGKFAKYQEHAKINKSGFWNMKFEYPWKWKEKIKGNKDKRENIGRVVR